MKFIANFKLLEYLKKQQSFIFFNAISTLIFIIVPCCVALLFADRWTHKNFWFYETALFSINLFTFLGLYKKGKLLNSTIKEVELTNDFIKFKTYDFYILRLFRLVQKNEKVSLADFRIQSVDFPIKEIEKHLTKGCFIIKINSKKYYLLQDYFDDKLLNKLLLQKNI